MRATVWTLTREKPNLEGFGCECDHEKGNKGTMKGPHGTVEKKGHSFSSV